MLCSNGKEKSGRRDVNEHALNVPKLLDTCSEDL